MVTVFVCGDVMLGRGIDQILEHPCAPTLHEAYLQDARDYILLAEEVSGPIPRGVPPAYPWGDALPRLAEARPDARIVNLETSITRADTWDREKGINYRVSPENAACLAAAEIDVCALGNNHVLDWGPQGLLDTLATLDALGIQRCGAGRDLAEATRPAVLDLAGHGRLVVFSVGCADAGVPPWWAAAPARPGVYTIVDFDDAELRALHRAIEPWRIAGSTIVLSIHWGPNWGYTIPAEHRRFAHRMIEDAGVDVVHGHSSHHVKGIEVHRGRPIFYGCGDLITDYEGIRGYERYRGDLGLLYLVTLAADGALQSVRMLPTRMRRFQLTRPEPGDIAWLADALARACAPLGTTIERGGDELRLRW